MLVLDWWYWMAVPMQYRLFSQMNSTGTCHSAARFSDSWNSPSGDGAFAKEAAGDVGLVLHLVGQGQAHRQGEVAGDDGVAADRSGLGIEEVHRAAAAAAAAFQLAVHLGHDRVRADAAGQGVAVLAIGGDDSSPPGVSACMTPTAMASSPIYRCRKPRILVAWYSSARFLLEAPDQQHLAQQVEQMLAVAMASSLVFGCSFCFHPVVSSVEVSPSGSPSSRDLSSRRMILPLRVLGRLFDEFDLLRSHRRAQFLASKAKQLHAQLLAGVVARL